MKKIGPIALVIMDGWGVAEDSDGNAIALAHKPFWEKLSTAYPHTTLLAAGEAVGLPKNEAGNSEVGHLNIGAGRVVYQAFPRINMAISDGSFLNNRAFLIAADNAKKNNRAVHLIGLIGRGSVHSSLEHIYALLWFAKFQRLKNVYLHLFTDGRDSPPTAALGVLKDLQDKIDEIGVGEIISICGRYYAMDRDNRWERTRRCYEALVDGKGTLTINPKTTLTELYEKGVTDEFIEPLLVTSGEEPVSIKNGDSVIFFNFRPDRARQLTKAFVDPTFAQFSNRKKLNNLIFVTMTEYEKNLPTATAFPPPVIEHPLSSIISENGLKQLHIGETEKYAHVTYFINGGREDPYSGEDRVHIPSPKVTTYDKKPEMSAVEITDYVCSKLQQNLYDVYIINFANADMVAHTGSIKATIKAVETIDECLDRIAEQTLELDGTLLITADHGNAESMINLNTGKPDTEHNTSAVPFIAVAKRFQSTATLKLPVGILADVAPTVLNLLKLEVPSTMTGRNLLPK